MLVFIEVVMNLLTLKVLTSANQKSCCVSSAAEIGFQTLKLKMPVFRYFSYVVQDRRKEKKKKLIWNQALKFFLT